MAKVKRSEEYKIKKRITDKIYRETHQEKVKAYRKWYQEVHGDKNRERARLYRINNPERKKEADKKYREENKQKLKEYKQEWTIKRRAENPIQRLKENLRHRVWMVLKGANKGGTLYDLVGCNKEFLVKWLEDQFTEGMTWDNMRKRGWHVDHKLPCASFDLSDPAQQKACFHYTNLQPLWWRDNLSKGSKIEQIPDRV